MEVKQIDFSKTLSEDQVYNCILQNYEALGTDWITHQWNWINAIYTSFQDHLKFLIIKKISVMRKVYSKVLNTPKKTTLNMLYHLMLTISIEFQI